MERRFTIEHVNQMQILKLIHVKTEQLHLELEEQKTQEHAIVKEICVMEPVESIQASTFLAR